MVFGFDVFPVCGRSRGVRSLLSEEACNHDGSSNRVLGQLLESIIRMAIVIPLGLHQIPDHDDHIVECFILCALFARRLRGSTFLIFFLRCLFFGSFHLLYLCFRSCSWLVMIVVYAGFWCLVFFPFCMMIKKFIPIRCPKDSNLISWFHRGVLMLSCSSSGCFLLLWEVCRGFGWYARCGVLVAEGGWPGVIEK